jgi:hypothetical protein
MVKNSTNTPSASERVIEVNLPPGNWRIDSNPEVTFFDDLFYNKKGNNNG